MYRIDIKEQNRIAMFHILNIDEERKRYLTDLQKISPLHSPSMDGMPHSTNISDPVSDEVQKIDEIEQKYAWVQVVEETEKALTEPQMKLLELRRNAARDSPSHVQGRPGWISYVQFAYPVWYEKRYKEPMNVPSKKTLIEWMNKITEIAVRIALFRGVMKIQ